MLEIPRPDTQQEASAPACEPKFSVLPRFGFHTSDLLLQLNPFMVRLWACQRKGYFTHPVLCLFPPFLTSWMLSKPGLYLTSLLTETKNNLMQGCPVLLWLQCAHHIDLLVMSGTQNCSNNTNDRLWRKNYFWCNSASLPFLLDPSPACVVCPCLLLLKDPLSPQTMHFSRCHTQNFILAAKFCRHASHELVDPYWTSQGAGSIDSIQI